MMGWSISVGRIFGTEVRIHLTFFLLVAWFAASAGARGGQSAAVDAVVFILAVFACVLAHEFGHHIADELSVQLGVKAIPNGDKNNELLADCFAGVHAHALSLGTDGRLDPGDIDEALAAYG